MIGRTHDVSKANASRIEALRSALLTRNRKLTGVDRFKPRTTLGRHALVLSEQMAAVSAALQAVTTYTNMIGATTVPPATFTTTPSETPGISSQDLENQYQTFTSQWAAMQGTANQWVNSDPQTNQPSILSQLTSVPQGLISIDSSVQYYLGILANLPPGSSTYDDDLQDLTNLISTESGLVGSLADRIGSFGESMNTQTNTVVNQVTTGAIAEIISAYQTEIDNLNSDISSLNDQIQSDNNQLIADYAVIGLDSATTVLGLTMLALPPVGFMMIGFGAYGIYQTVNDISALNNQIASDSAKVTTETSVASTDTSEVSNLQAFANTVQGYTSLNARAQQELITLQNMYDELNGYLNTMTTDLGDNDLSGAADEWNEIISGANSLAGITLYIWPPMSQIYAPNALSPGTNGGVYVITNSGSVYYWAKNALAWSSISGKALSVMAANNTLIKINGAPANGTTSQNPYDTDYCLYRYNSSGDTWTQLSNFAVANFATDGTDVYCIKQTSDSDNQYVYQYSGSGTGWSQLPALPNSAVPRLMTVVDGSLFVTTFNQGILYQYQSGSWQQLSPDNMAVVSLNGGNGYIGYIDQNKKSYLYNLQNQQTAEQSGADIIGLGQSKNAIQYLIDTSQTLSVSVIEGGNYRTTALCSNAVSINTGIDTGTPVYGDNQGALYALDGSPSATNNSWTKLPDLPSSQGSGK